MREGVFIAGTLYWWSLRALLLSVDSRHRLYLTPIVTCLRHSLLSIHLRDSSQEHLIAPYNTRSQLTLSNMRQDHVYAEIIHVYA